MNIFILDEDPVNAAMYHNDKHVVKMILETAQLLCAAHHVNGTELNEKDLYKLTHKNHPCAIWARESFANYAWLVRLGFNLCNEYIDRFGKIHKTNALITLLSTNYPLKFEKDGRTPFILAMPEACKIGGAVESYRNYYMKEKRHLAVWAKRDIPFWFK